jgi:hypothetical protein
MDIALRKRAKIRLHKSFKKVMGLVTGEGSIRMKVVFHLRLDWHVDTWECFRACGNVGGGGEGEERRRQSAFTGAGPPR